MNVLNEKMRIIRNQIEAEKKKDTPNYANIQKLENELKNYLKGVS